MVELSVISFTASSHNSLSGKEGHWVNFPSEHFLERNSNSSVSSSMVHLGNFCGCWELTDVDDICCASKSRRFLPLLLECCLLLWIFARGVIPEGEFPKERFILYIKSSKDVELIWCEWTGVINRHGWYTMKRVELWMRTVINNWLGWCPCEL